MAQSNPTIEQALAELRKKQAAIERGEAPVAPANQEPEKITEEEKPSDEEVERVMEHLVDQAAIKRETALIIPPGGWPPLEVPPLPYSVTEAMKARGPLPGDPEIKPVKFIEEETIENVWAALDKAQFITGAWTGMPFADLPESEQEKFARILGHSEEIEHLKNLLRRTAIHIAARNALGEKSKEFCCACNNARHEACVLPEIWKAVE